ncbi:MULTISPECIES: NAD-dependent epimerase [Thalassolituus]|jgi:UDP-glucuronate 4-epimerase|uniref:NAD-dependent epimerase n=1 Tax=Thalassolituus TaxID=187492 RepID=UPI000C4C11B0|nr:MULTISPECIES: NAD-dependent epimerase [Thalassolituus]MAY14832.1 capsular biosynthesis protein CpsI [Oceanospirillaceae bacterium]MCA6060875.1 NAD-dependent epimerase [Thalassolituus sp. ST750PaO-4]MCB2387968.1 NAD-dependent epimerase [Thalassolituus alkanivorans]MCB2422494.1 NAD-dependent epimerase [Thalassolituus alkanivorans]
MKILVTGAAGFIGAFTSKRFVEQGHEVIGIDNLNDYYDVNLKHGRLGWLAEQSGFTFKQVELSDRAAVDAVFAEHKFDRVVHLAAQAGVRYSITNPHAYVDSNLIGFVNILEACRHNEVGHLVYASSSSVYGLNTKIPYSTSDRVDHPVSLYAATKKSNELMAHTYAHLYGLPVTGLRFFTVYGPWGRPDMAYFSFTRDILEGKTINVFNHGKMQRDFTYVDDIVEGVTRITQKIPQGVSGWTPESGDCSRSSAPYKIYNIGNHNSVELGTFIETIENVLGKKANKNYMEMQPGDVLATYANVDDLVEDVDFAPNTPLAEGIERFARWYRDFYKV